MSDGFITGDVAARLLKITPRELERLAKDGVIPRDGPDKYVLAIVVHAYIDYLNKQIEGREFLSQTELAERMDISDRRLRDLLKDFGLDHRRDAATDIIIAYIRKLREEAAGRSDKELAAVRARETMASAQLKELDLAEKIGRVVYVDDIAPAMAQLVAGFQSQIMNAGNKILQSLESIGDIEINDEIVNDPLRSALGHIASSAAQFGQADSDEPGGVDSDAA